MYPISTSDTIFNLTFLCNNLGRITFRKRNIQKFKYLAILSHNCI